MLAREARLRRRSLLRFVAGIAIVLVMLAGVVGITSWVCSRAGTAGPHRDATDLALLADALLLALTLPIASLTRKESRSDVAQHFLDTGGGAIHATDDAPLLRFALALLVVGLLYGEFLLVDAIAAWWLDFRLRRVDRSRAAVILGMLFTDPRGLDPTQLLRFGESPLELRRTVAHLIAQEWVDVSPDGRYMNLVSPAKLALRR
jgi:hypothetical protein